MTKEEFLKKFNEEKLNIGPYIMVFDQITDEPLILGCVNEGGKWKIFETKERGGHFIIEQFDTEEEAFDFFYEIVMFFHKVYTKKR